MAKVKSERDLVNSGIKASVDALGYSGAARFLRHFSKGEGDYLVIQEKLFKGMDLERSTRRQRSIIEPNSHSTFREFPKRRSSSRNGTNRFCPGSVTNAVVSPVTNTSFSVHDHELRTRVFSSPYPSSVCSSPFTPKNLLVRSGTYR